MSQNIIIECRNKTSLNKLSNGDWVTNLPENIEIEQGDQILIKSSFIDTQQSSSSKILIPNNITVSIDYGFYIVDDNQEFYTPADPLLSPNSPTFENFVLTRTIEPVTDLKLVGEYFLTTEGPNISSIASDIDFFWNDETGIKQNLKISIPSLEPNQKYKVRELTSQLVINQIFTEQNLSNYGLKQLGAVYIPVNNKIVMEPYSQTKSIKIPKGNYDPNELCNLINKEFTNNNLGGFTEWTTNDNEILQSGRHIQSKFYDGSKITSQFWITRASNANPNYIYQMPLMTEYPNKNIGSIKDNYFGASQLELDFDNNTKYFKFNYLHTPKYINSNISVSYRKINNQDIITVNKTGGIYFRRLYASNDDLNNQTFDFWENILGFDTNSLIPEFGYTDINAFEFPKGTTNNYLTPQTVTLRDYITTTGGLSSIASAFDISTPPIVENPPFDRGIDSSSTTNIIAKNSSLDVSFSFGYFIVEVNSQFKNMFLTEDNNYRNVQQIVSRYYELNSYTNGNSDGSIIYEHPIGSEPLLLQSFKCRILDSDKNLAQNLGIDNTIHIEIIKSQRDENN